MHSLLGRWLRRTDRFWDHLLSPLPRRSRPDRPARLALAALEDRLAPAATPAYAVGAAPGERPEVRLYDPAGTLVRTIPAFEDGFRGGVQAALADLTGDGVPDVAAAPGRGGPPLVKVFDGRTGGLVSSFLAYDPSFAGGVNVAAGDVGHGVRGLVTAPASGSPPLVKVFTADGQLRRSFLAYEKSFAGGVRVALGYAKTGNAAVFTAPGEGGGPRVRGVEVRSGKEVANFMAFEPDFRGGGWVAAADQNGDGVSEVVTGAGAGGGPRVRVFSGQTGTVLQDFFAADPADRSGVAVGAAGGKAAGVVAVAAGAAGRQARRFDPRGTVADLFAGLGAGVTVSAPAQLAEVKTYDPADPTPRDLGRAFTAFSAPRMGSATPEVLRAGAGLGASPSAYSDFPVRYGDGVVQYAEQDLAAGGFGADWGVTRSWTNEQAYTQGQNVGRGWVIGQTPSLLRQVDEFSGAETLTVVSSGTDARYFDRQADGTYLGRSGVLDALTYDAAAGKYLLTDPAGQKVWFWDFDASRPGQQQGRFARLEDPAGNATEVTAETADGRIAEVQRSATANGTTVTESYLFAFVSDGANAGLIASITQRRRVGAGAWGTVRSVEYTYYDGTEPHGNAQDLKTAVVKDPAGAVLSTSYYRYYATGGGAGGPGGELEMGFAGGSGDLPGGYQSGLKYVLTPEGYARAVGAGLDPLTATDEQLAPYAAHYFEYDDRFRVTKETAAGAGDDAAGGRGTFTYAYTPSEVMTATVGGVADYNAWTVKTVETLPDGTAHTVYTNAADQVMLKAYTAGTQTWRWFYRYDTAGRAVLAANPSAVTGHDDAYADLVNYQSGNAQYLADAAGLVTVQEYGAATTATAAAAGDAAGRLKRVSVRRGELGTDVPQQDSKYVKRTVGTRDLFFEAESTRYRNADGTGAQTTTTAYTWQGTTAQPAAVTVTAPTVSAAQNGPGTATSLTTVYDAYGRPVWERDGDGFLTYTAYDPATGAAVKRIVDVDTAQTATFQGLPAGWATPAGGGLHLTTTTEVDALGRPTKVTRPNGRVDYLTYNDAAKEARTYPGWDAAANAPTGPTQVVRADWGRGYTETLTMSAAPAVSGGRPTGAEAVSGLQTLSRAYTNPGGQVVYTDAYFNLAGLTYTTGTALGTQNAHFYRTQAGYDARGRQDRVVSPAGTVTRSVYDGPGRAVSEWVGLDDAPTAGDWSPANAAGTDLVKVREWEYDGGGVGDGNRTRATEYPGLGAAARVTQTWYDWRNRPVAVKQGVEASESADVNRPITYTQFDNLGRAVAVERYDGDGVTVTATNGVPDRPAASLLRAKSAAEYDDLGRTVRSMAYSVDPATGAVSATALTTATWYDRRGHAIKVSIPGGLVTKTRYDGAGRATTVSTTDGGGDVSWADAGTVAGDAVLAQTDTQYDGGGNPVLTVARERFHDETGTGALGTPTTSVKARVSYAASYYDLADRLIASVDVGTNGGTAWTRPAAVPAGSDAVLVTSQTYDAAGRVRDVTDPRGLVTRTEYDALGRATKTVENYVDGVPSDADDKTTEFGYGPAGRVSLTARLPGGGGQTTAWVYGVSTAAGSGVNSNDLVGATRWPDPATGAASASEQETVAVNAHGQEVTRTDRNGTVHAYTYDVLGRETADTVTLLGTNVDGGVRRIETAYDGQGNPYLFTSYDAATGGSVVNQVKREHNGLGQVVSDWQSHAGAVTGSTPRVQYAYSMMSGGANHSRLTAVTYPNGRVVSYAYAAGPDDAVSRLSALSDATGTLETYAYLGADTVVVRGRPQPGVDLTYVKPAGEADGDAGDRYTGLDRFGRVADQRWRRTGDGTHADRFTYTYDRDGNRTAKGNPVNTAFNETYGYDGLNQLTSFARTGRSQAWDYDALGNWESVTTDGANQARTHNRQNEITGVSGATAPAFDAAGNTIRDEAGRQLVYDAWDRPVRVNDAGGNTLAAYAYDGRGYRVSATAGGATTDLYYSDRWQVLEERQGGVAKVQSVWSPVYVDALVARDRDADGSAANGLEERLYAQQDANFNVTALLNVGGAVVERFTFDPFGTAQVRDAAWAVKPGGSGYAWVYLHQGGRLDPASGLVHFRNRDYSPTLGKWDRLDPVEYVSGDTNLYRFVSNSPSGNTDPSGLGPTKVVVWVVRLAKNAVKGNWKPVKQSGPISNTDDIARMVREGEDLAVKSKHDADRIAKIVEGPNGKAIHEVDHKTGSTHAHVQTPSGGRHPGHIIYTGLSAVTLTYWAEGRGTFIEGAAAVGDFFNPLSIPKDIVDIGSDIYNMF